MHRSGLGGHLFSPWARAYAGNFVVLEVFDHHSGVEWSGPVVWAEAFLAHQGIDRFDMSVVPRFAQRILRMLILISMKQLQRMRNKLWAVVRASHQRWTDPRREGLVQLLSSSLSGDGPLGDGKCRKSLAFVDYRCDVKRLLVDASAELKVDCPQLEILCPQQSRIIGLDLPELKRYPSACAG